MRTLASSKCRGFSLVEVLIAAVLLALGLVPVAFMFFTTVRETGADLMELEATGMATEMLEQVRSIAEGRIGVAQMGMVPAENPFPKFPNWIDVDDRLRYAGQGFPLIAGCAAKAESSRMYLQPSKPGFRRFVQFMPAPLLLSDEYARSPYLLEVRARVDYGRDPDDARGVRSVVLDTLLSHEDVSIPR